MNNEFKGINALESLFLPMSMMIANHCFSWVLFFIYKVLLNGKTYYCIKKHCLKWVFLTNDHCHCIIAPKIIMKST